MDYTKVIHGARLEVPIAAGLIGLTSLGIGMAWYSSDRSSGIIGMISGLLLLIYGIWDGYDKIQAYRTPAIPPEEYDLPP